MSDQCSHAMFYTEEAQVFRVHICMILMVVPHAGISVI